MVFLAIEPPHKYARPLVKRRKLVERQPDEGTIEWLLTLTVTYGGLIVAGFFALLILAVLVSTIVGVIRQL